MAFTLDTLAQELGIPVETLQAKPDVVSKWNGYLTEADKKYSDATAAQKAATEALEQAKRDQTAIDEQITKFGVTEARLAELQTANAALTAAIEEVKKQGLNVTLPVQPAAVTPPDPTKTLEQTLRTGFSQMGEALRVQTRYQAVFGKPFVDDPVKLVDEAIAAKLPVAEYAERKYKFAEETERQRKADEDKRIADGVAAGVKKYQEDHPITAGHPGLARGRESLNGKIMKPRTAQEQKEFRNLPVKQRLAASVARAREAAAALSAE